MCVASLQAYYVHPWGENIVSKPLSLFFSVLAIVFMSAMAVSISYNGWLVLTFGFLSLFTIGAGFIVKARLRRKKQG
jgi:hypothetical protein